MITNQGKTALRRYLAGYDKMLADTIVLGIGSAPGEKMDCEWLRMPVTILGTNPDNESTVFKAIASPSSDAKIYEVGLIQGAGGVTQDVVISNFTINEGWNSTFTTTNSRLGQAAVLNSGATITKSVNGIDVSVFTESDVVTLATNSSGTGRVTAKLIFDDETTASFAFNVVSGYNVVKVSKSNATKTGNVRWNGLIGVEMSSNVNVSLDLLKFSPASNLNELLIARKILTTPFSVTTNLPLEVEYPLGVRVA